ncbi:hypothetical protein PRIC1_012169 [Phytophthora ramorum]|nr:hypothetical protein KRP22_13883 [Phytophthora ramorum]
MLFRLTLVAALLAVLATAEPFRATPTDANTEERTSTSIFTTLSHNGPMAGMGARRLEPLPTPGADEERSFDFFTPLSDDGPMAGTGARKLRQ